MALEMRSPNITPEMREYILKEWGVEVPITDDSKKKKGKKNQKKEIIEEKKEYFNHAMMKHSISFGIGYSLMCLAVFFSTHFPDLFYVPEWIYISDWMMKTLPPFIGFTKCLVIIIMISSLFSLYKSDLDSMQRNRFCFSFISGITQGVGITSISFTGIIMIYNLLSIIRSISL